MGRGTPEGSIARFDLGQGSQAPGVHLVGSQPSGVRHGLLTSGGNPSILVDGTVVVAAETVGTGDGVEVTFSGTLASPVVAPSSVTISSTNVSNAAISVTDDGNGALTGDGTGTINYATGAYSVTFSSAVKNATAVSAAYTHAVVLSCGPAAGEVWRDCVLRIHLVGGKNFDSDKFGGGTGLSSGLTVKLGGYTVPFPLKNNADFDVMATKTEAHAVATSDGWISFDFDAGILDGDAGEVCSITVSEDLSAYTTPSQTIAIVMYRDVG